MPHAHLKLVPTVFSFASGTVNWRMIANAQVVLITTNPLQILECKATRVSV